MCNTFINFDLVSFDKAITFTLNSENRAINRGHLQTLKKQWLTSASLIPPISVNTVTNHIVDGQHRWSSYVDLVRHGELPRDTKLKVMYVSIDKTEEKEAILNANTHTKNWVIDDYVAGYAKSGNENYIKLTEWCNSHELANSKTKNEIKPKYTYGATIITGKDCRKALMNGDFVITEEDLKRAETVHAEMVELKNTMNIQGSNSWIRTLAVTWYDYRNLHNFNVFLKELKNKMKTVYFKRHSKQSNEDFKTLFSAVHAAIDLNTL